MPSAERPQTCVSLYRLLREKKVPLIKLIATCNDTELDQSKRFPRAACLIDVLRCTLAVDTADQVLEAFVELQKQEGFTIMRYGGTG